MKKLFFSLCFLFSLFLYGQNNNNNGLDSYKKENSKQFLNATEMSTTVFTELQKRQIKNPKFYVAIVFPELMRYSKKRDFAEIIATELSYALDKDYLICSIGWFQIKPSFAQKIERLLDNNKEISKKYNRILYNGKDNDYLSRLERIKRLQDFNLQIDYLCAFVDLMIEKFSLKNKPIEYQLKIISSAYNWGLDKTLLQLEELSSKNAYPQGYGNKNSKWCYTQIVLDFYLN